MHIRSIYQSVYNSIRSNSRGKYEVKLFVNCNNSLYRIFRPSKSPAVGCDAATGKQQFSNEHQIGKQHV